MPSSPRTPTGYPGPPAQKVTRGVEEQESDSDSSQITAVSASKPSPYHRRRANRPTSIDASASVAHSSSRPPNPRVVTEPPSRNISPTVEAPSAFHLGHRPRQRSQGYFEPTLSSSHASPAMSQLTPSQIAAQAAMMHTQSSQQNNRKRSTTIPEPGAGGTQSPQTSPPPLPGQVTFRTNGMTYQNGIVGGHRVAAATAANVVFPKSPLHSPGEGPSPQYPYMQAEQKPVKEKSKMKLPFSKPKGISTSKEKDLDRKHPALPSPNKIAMANAGALNRLMLNASTTSLADPNMSGNSSLYSSANASTSTLVPMERTQTHTAPENQKEKEKHKHNFLLRQKHKLKDKDDHHLPLSSASSSSKPTDPSAPQPLYSFAAPASPGHSTTFAQSVTGLDLRHGGRGLRQKKKEEKAASSLAPFLEAEREFKERNQSFSLDRSEWSAGASTPAVAIGPSPAGDLAGLGASFGIQGLTPDDAWPLLKARLLHIFEGEDPRPPIEDFNALVLVHIRRCIQKQAPNIIIGDVNELLQTGFSSLDQTIRHIPDDRLVPHLVEMWLIVFTTILPFLQAVFLPLDLEFRGRGSLLAPHEASEFWSAALPCNPEAQPDQNIPSLGYDLEVRRLVLLTFRDVVILPRHDTLTAIFSRLSIENLAAGLTDPVGASSTNPTILPSDPNALIRPSTSASTASPSAFSSLNSGSTNFLDNPLANFTPSSSLPSSTTPFATALSNTRSRATSSTSAGSFHSTPLHPPPSAGSGNATLPRTLPRQMDSATVTETVGRMLQCMSVLASVQSGDEAQRKMERLTKELKYNWLGRGRTGRQRRGFVGAKLPRAGAGQQGVAVAAGGGGVAGGMPGFL